MNYKVGQFLYICDEERIKIIPVQVVEEIIRKTIEGTEKKFKIMFPDSENTVIVLEKVKGKIFEDIDSIQDYMIKNASDAIKRMRIAAESLRDQSFKKEKNDVNVINKDSQKENSVQADVNNDIITVDLGNGVKAKMNTSILDKVAQ